MKILVTPTSFGREGKSPARELLESFAERIVYNPYGRPLVSEELIPLLEGVDGYIAGLDFINSEVIENAPSSLKIISRYGVGYERVDIGAANKRGIKVTNTPGINAESVADLAFGLIMSVARGICNLDKQVKAGQWPRTKGVEIYGKTIGILGLGAIGKGVAKRAGGFSMKVLACDPCFDTGYVKENGIKICSLDELFSLSDIISLHLPLNDDTRNLINADSITGMKKGIIIINTSRGGILDETAVYAALREGRIGGLGLDVFEKEPPGNSKLLELENVVATPHAGAHTSEAIDKMGLLAVKNLIDVLTGRKCKHLIAQNDSKQQNKIV